MKSLLKIFVPVCVVCLSVSFGYAQINININVPPPPQPVVEQPVEEAGPPPIEVQPTEMVVVPSLGQPVYLVPGMVGVYFTGGFWFRYWGNAWYRTAVYGGPWVAFPTPPAYVTAIPPDYILSVPPAYHRIYYNDFRSYWRKWGRSHYWDHQSFYRDHIDHRWSHHNVAGYDRYNNWNHNRGWAHDKAFQERVRENRERVVDKAERNRERALDKVESNRQRGLDKVESNRERALDKVDRNRDLSNTRNVSKTTSNVNTTHDTSKTHTVSKPASNVSNTPGTTQTHPVSKTTSNVSQSHNVSNPPTGNVNKGQTPEPNRVNKGSGSYHEGGK